MFNEIISFLKCRTPSQWLEAACKNINLLLVDHAHCERKAVSTVMSLLFRYPQDISLLQTLSCVAREELRHFEMVLKILKKHNISYSPLSPGRYAKTLHDQCRSQEPERFLDSFLIAALIEARSCERFISLQNVLSSPLGNFYKLLAHAEARHYRIYLEYAQRSNAIELRSRLDFLIEIENQLILGPDTVFRFHSGIPL